MKAYYALLTNKKIRELANPCIISFDYYMSRSILKLSLPRFTHSRKVKANKSSQQIRTRTISNNGFNNIRMLTEVILFQKNTTKRTNGIPEKATSIENTQAGRRLTTDQRYKGLCKVHMEDAMGNG